MKIGIVTFCKANNYGALLQTYALQETLKEYTENVQVLNYLSEQSMIMQKTFDIRAYKHIKGLKDKVNKFIKRVKNYKERKTSAKNFKAFGEKYLNFTNFYKKYSEFVNNPLDVDVIVCGSDQVWNTDITAGYDSIYFLDIPTVKPAFKMSYAASVGRKDFEPTYKQEIEKQLKTFNYISVREKSSIKLIENASGKAVTNVLDPTLIANKKIWERLCEDSQPLTNITDKYMLVYVFNNDQNVINIANKISKDLKLKVVSISRNAKYDNLMYETDSGNVAQFVKLIKDSEFVVTNSFHGTCFSLIFEKKFYVIPHTERGSRMTDLLEILEASDRVMYNVEQLPEDITSYKVDYNKINKNLDREREISKNYLKTSIENFKGAK